MKVISDTSPLIALGCIQKISILRDLFGKILIPKAVLSETQYLFEDIKKLPFMV